MDIIATTPVLNENPVDVINLLMAEKLFNKRTGYDVNTDDILEYLSVYSNNKNIPDRVKHFKAWLNY
jgi:hypothetical protein